MAWRMGAHLEGNGEDVEDEGGHKEGVEYSKLTAGHNSGQPTFFKIHKIR
jgi:hypothetical protein